MYEKKPSKHHLLNTHCSECLTPLEVGGTGYYCEISSNEYCCQKCALDGFEDGQCYAFVRRTATGEHIHFRVEFSKPLEEVE